MRYVTSKVPFGSALKSLGRHGAGCLPCISRDRKLWAGWAKWAGWADEKSIPPHLWKFSQAGRIYLLLTTATAD